VPHLARSVVRSPDLVLLAHGGRRELLPARDQDHTGDYRYDPKEEVLHGSDFSFRPCGRQAVAGAECLGAVHGSPAGAHTGTRKRRTTNLRRGSRHRRPRAGVRCDAEPEDAIDVLGGLNPFYLSLLRGIEDVAAEQGTLVLITDTRDSPTPSSVVVHGCFVVSGEG
jgi:hypothetical protein